MSAAPSPADASDPPVAPAAGAAPEAASDERTAAIRALELEFGELFTHARRIISDHAERLSPGLLPGAYKTFTTIARREQITLSALAETLHSDKGQVSRSVRELEALGLIERTPDPDDGRSSLLSATATGIERLHAIRGPGRSPLLNALHAWDLEDVRTLTHLLHALAAGESPH